MCVRKYGDEYSAALSVQFTQEMISGYSYNIVSWIYLFVCVHIRTATKGSQKTSDPLELA